MSPPDASHFTLHARSSCTSHVPSATRRAAMVWAAWLAAGCTGGLLPKPAAAPTRYTLGDSPPAPGPASTQPLVQAAPAAPSVVVALPNAAPGFDSTRMVYLRQPQVLQAYAYAEWVDTPSRLLLPLMVQALQRTGAYRAVLQAPSSATAALRLETELLRLQHDHTASPSVVRLSLRALLLNAATRQPLGTREFDARVPALSDSPEGGAAAAATATRLVLADLADYVAGFSTGFSTGFVTGTRREP